MTLERVLKAAAAAIAKGTKQPFCFAAHVPGQGYTNRGQSSADDLVEYRRQAARAIQSEIENMGFAAAYAEPGYADPDKGILFANWNRFPRNFDRILERLGYECEWSDEWSTCGDCGKAFRTQPDCWTWQPSYKLVFDCELVCSDCITENGYTDEELSEV